MVHAFNCSLASPASTPCATSDAGVGSPGRAWGRPGSQVVLHWCFHFCGFLQPVEMCFCFRVGVLFCIFLNLPSSSFSSCSSFVSADTDLFLLTYCTVRSHLSLRKPKRSQVPICCHLTRLAWPGAAPWALWPALTMVRVPWSWLGLLQRQVWGSSASLVLQALKNLLGHKDSSRPGHLALCLDDPCGEGWRENVLCAGQQRAISS